jgi:hypothetical protein
LTVKGFAAAVVDVGGAVVEVWVAVVVGAVAVVVVVDEVPPEQAVRNTIAIKAIIMVRVNNRFFILSSIRLTIYLSRVETVYLARI